MLGSFKPVVFDPYGSRRPRWVLPRWLVLLLAGIVLGAGAVVLIQERYLPPRLSADESIELRKSFEQADADRIRLKNELGETAKRLDASLAEKKSLNDELTTSRDTVARLRTDVDAAVASLPTDPRGGAVAIRAARFAAKGRALAYDVVLSRERAADKPFTGVMQFTVAGDPGRGPEKTVVLEPVPVSLGKFVMLRGTVPLPEGFKPRQSTINVLDRVNGTVMGMRVMIVN